MSIKGAKPLIFIHSKVDDAALSPNEFRVLAHLTRRAGSNGICKPGIRSIAKNCRIGKDTAQSVIEVLKEKCFIAVSKPDKSRSVHSYTLTIEEGIAASVPIQGTDKNPSVPIQGTDKNPSVPIGTPNLSRSKAHKDIRRIYNKGRRYAWGSRALCFARRAASFFQ